MRRLYQGEGDGDAIERHIYWLQTGWWDRDGRQEFHHNTRYLRFDNQAEKTSSSSLPSEEGEDLSDGSAICRTAQGVKL
jgi:hypothetical protein